MSSASYFPIVCLFLLATAFLNGARGKPMPAEQNEQQQQQKAQPQSNGSSSPSPLEACLQKISSTVCDPNGVLNAEQTQKLNDALAQMSKQTQQEGYAFDKSQRAKCGQQGITMPVVILKEASQDLSATEKQLIGMNKEWTQQNPCDRVTILMINAGDNVEQRSFWAGRNWNVNVDPSELVKMYQNEVENIKKADYVQALINIIQQFITTASKRSGPPADPKAFQQKVQPVSAAAADQPQQQQPQNDGESMVKAEGSSATNAANTAEQNKSEGASNAESKSEAKAESKSEQPEKC